MGSLWEQRRNFLSGEGGIRPGFHILYKTVTRQWPHLLFSRSVLSDSLGPHRLQHARLSCPSLTPRVYSNSNSNSILKLESVMPSNISSSVVPFPCL